MSVLSPIKAFPLPARDAPLSARPLPPHSSRLQYWAPRRERGIGTYLVLSSTEGSTYASCATFWVSPHGVLMWVSRCLPVPSTLQILPHMVHPCCLDTTVSSPWDSPLDIVIARCSSLTTFHVTQFTPRKVGIVAMPHEAGESWLPHYSTCPKHCLLYIKLSPSTLHLRDI